MRKLWNLYWHGHWQNLDDANKVELADSALSDAIHTIGALSEEHWDAVRAAKTVFHNKLRGRLGHGWRNGRGWLNLYQGDPDRGGRALLKLGAQWLLLKRQHSIGASFEAGGGDSERDISWSLRIPGFGFYFTLEDALPRHWRFYNPGQKYPSSRQLSVAWHSQALWFYLWADPDESHSRAPFWHPCSRWRTPTIHPLDILLGRTRCTTEVLGEEAAEVVLPEGCYPVKIVIERRTWRRSRWPWACKTRVSANVRSEDGIPIPGKGENSWDCGEDAYYSIGTAASTAAEAVRSAADAVLETRKRYGGYNWRPRSDNE